VRTGKRVAVIGSGPAGLAAAQQLNRAGHTVTVFEKADRIGGLLRYGIPDFKMEKHHIDRRLQQMIDEGVEFKTNAHVGVNVALDSLPTDFDALVLAGGAEQPRDLNVPGRELNGIYFAMDFLPQQNKRVAGDKLIPERETFATGKHVIIIGGGDTGADCLGTSHRHKAASITQFEIMPQPPAERASSTPWPLWPLMLRQESSHEEGGTREFAIQTTKFVGDENGNVTELHTVRVDSKFQPIPGTEKVFKADLVLLAMGFTGPVRKGMIEQLQLETDARGNVKTDDNYMSSRPGIFAAGDMRRGQSLVVWAIAEGRKAARAVDQWLMGESKLPA
jgi:glutamate synthase (NADPH/NADH) small chain